MADNKRKTTTSTAVKQRWIDKNLAPVPFRVPKELKEQFKAKCEKRGDTMSGVLTQAIKDYLRRED